MLDVYTRGYVPQLRSGCNLLLWQMVEDCRFSVLSRVSIFFDVGAIFFLGGAIEAYVYGISTLSGSFGNLGN